MKGDVSNAASKRESSTYTKRVTNDSYITAIYAKILDIPLLCVMNINIPFLWSFPSSSACSPFSHTLQPF